ncbi:hypothetical protein AB3H13_26920 [Escherichia coli]
MNELAEANAEHVTTISKLEQKLTDMAVQLANAESKCRELAAENSGLKKFCKDAAFDADYEAELGMERGGFTNALNDIKTPATDAFLAEVRAQGVEMAACALDDVNQFNYANMLDELAQKLRKGGAA